MPDPPDGFERPGGGFAFQMITEPTNDSRICGIFDDREEARVPATKEGLPKLGRIDELLEFGRQAEIDMLIVALPMAAEQRLVQLLKTLWVLPVDIRLSARDLEDLKVKALEEGMPYQTLMASVLHRYATGQLRRATPG